MGKKDVRRRGRKEENAKKHGRKMLGIKRLTWKKERSYKERKNYIWKKGKRR